MATAKEREEFLSVLQEELFRRGNVKVRGMGRAEVLDAGRKLLRHARTHGNWAAEACNGPPDQWYRWVDSGGWTKYRLREAMQEREDTITLRMERAAKRIRELCAGLGLKVELGGDPRGYTVKLHFPSGRYNTWGGRESGYGVPQ